MKSFQTLYVLLSWSIFTSIQAKQLKRPYLSEPKTFPELINFVKTSPNIWDTNTSMLSEQSINTLKKGAQAASLDKAQFNVLFDMVSARIPFTGNAEQDKKYAMSYVIQKEDILKDYQALSAPETKPLQEQQKGMEAPQINQTEMTQFVTELIQKYADNLKTVFIDQKIIYQTDTPETISPIIKELKEKYRTPEAQEAVKPILINKLKETLPGISATSLNNIEDYLDIALPSE